MTAAITAINAEKNCEVKAMNEYLKRDEVLGKLDAMIAYWETRDDCWVHTLQVARSAIASIEPVEEKWVRVDERLPDIIDNASEDVLIHFPEPPTDGGVKNG